MEHQIAYARTFVHFALKGPELLTMLGILEKFGLHGHNAKLSDASVANETKMYRWMKRDLAILRSYPRQRQSPGTLLSTDIMDYFLDDLTRAEKFRFHDYPLNQMFGVQSELPNFMLTMHPVVSQLERRNYVKRLNRFGVKFDQVLEGLRIREEKGVLPPRFVIRRVLDEMTAFSAATSQGESALHGFQGQSVQTGEGQRAKPGKPARRSRGRHHADGIPRLPEIYRLFHRTGAKSHDDDGVWKLPEGDKYYAHCLRSNTSTEYTPEQVHEIGLKEVNRIEGEMGVILNLHWLQDVRMPPRNWLNSGKRALPLPEYG